MTDLPDLLPMLGLRITAGPLELRGILDEDLPALCDLVLDGIHPPGEMPFNTPWSTAPPAERVRNTAQYHWRTRADFGPERWSLNLGVWREGTLIGCQGFDTSDYLVTRTGETGSWLGRGHQGRGHGTAMRQAMCAFVFDHLGAEEITSGAFLDNPASLAVSRKVGYRPDAVERRKRREGELALHQRLVLTPAKVRAWGTPRAGRGWWSVPGVDRARRPLNRRSRRDTPSNGAHE